MSMNGLVHHVESTVGQIDSGWRPKESASGIVVVRIGNRPSMGVSTYLTLGLSHHVLAIGAGREVRQEFVFTADERFESAHVSSFLQAFAEFVLGKHSALLRGEVVGPSEQVIPGVRLNSVYVAIPVLHDERLRTFVGTLPPTVFAWVIPIHEEEANYVHQRGWEAFEERLEAADTNLWDLERDSVV